MSSNGTESATAAAAVSSTTQSQRTARSSSQNRNESTKAAASSSSLKDVKTPSSGLFNSLRATSTANNSQNGNTTRSPTSPSRITRLQEKEEMQNLNDRLVIYIDTVRRLESENSRLQNIVQSYSEHSTRDVTEIKQPYERELESDNFLIDLLAIDVALYQNEANMHQANAQKAITKFERRDKEHKEIDTKLKTLESEYAEYKTRCEKAQNDLGRFQAELSQLRPHASELEKQLNKLKKQLEDEALLRVDLENKNTSLKEDLKSQIYDKEMAFNLHNSYLNESSMLSGPSTTHGNNKKRRLAQGDEEQVVLEPSGTYYQSSESKVGILIAEHDIEGNSVTLSNPTDVDIPMANWVIKRTSTDGPAIEHKFSKNSVLKSQAQITV